MSAVSLHKTGTSPFKVATPDDYHAVRDLERIVHPTMDYLAKMICYGCDGHGGCGGCHAELLIDRTIPLVGPGADRNVVGCLFLIAPGAVPLPVETGLQGKVYIAWLAVRPDYHRLGLGTLLLDRLVDQVASRCRGVWLHCQCDNYVALAFYYANGFKLYRVVPKYYESMSGPGSPDAVILVKSW